jgi:serine phosphatase RsbU (regulator of sigma subunit)
VLAVSGWSEELVHSRLDVNWVLSAGASAASRGPAPYKGWPPGIPPRHADIEGAELHAGLYVPLVAQNETVGLMIVHSTRKPHFTAGEIALLQAFADQAAVAIQRTALIESLQEKIDQLQAAQIELVRKERLERELELARQVQQNLLPRTFVQFPGYAFAAKNESARRVGGDFYDVFRIGDRHCGIVIADVSDKGMPAALFMALTRSLLLAEARRELSPRQVLTNVNRLLLELGERDMFVTVFYGVLDKTANTMTYARAGHERPLLLRHGKVQTLPGEGRFLGFWDQPPLSLSEEQLTLQHGDRLVLYTDGLLDALNPADDAFGRERLVQLLHHSAHRSPAEICEETFSALALFQGNTEQFDDMAMLVVGVD